jgi:putative ABC transport system permease protein
MAYAVSRREREFGIRIALGSNRERILRLLYGSVLRLFASGMVLGILLAYAARVWIASMVGAESASPGAVVLGGLLLGVVAAIATAAPAHRATRIRPMEALRNE